LEFTYTLVLAIAHVERSFARPRSRLYFYVVLGPSIMPTIVIEIAAANEGVGKLSLSIVIDQVCGFSATPNAQVAIVRMRPNVTSDGALPILITPTGQFKGR
jgi:hypothetical protein